MDILTPKGQKTVADEMLAADIWHAAYPTKRYVCTPKNRPALIDAFLVENDQIIAGVESKCRYDLTLERFCNNFNAEWLVTRSKIEGGAKICDALGVPFVGFMFLVEEKRLLCIRLFDKMWLTNIHSRISTTKRSINTNDTIDRENSYINMKDARVIEHGHEFAFKRTVSDYCK